MSQEHIDDCFAIKNNSEALDCLKDLVRTAQGECRPKLVLFTQENCLPCNDEKVLHQEAIREGIIQEVSINSQEGRAIAAKNEIDFVPSLVLLDCKDNLIYPAEGV